MKYAKVKKVDAEKIKQLLLEKKYLHKNYGIIKEKEHILFPITDSGAEELSGEKKVEGVDVVEAEGIKKEERYNFLDLLKKVIPEKELCELTKSFDIVGDIAIIQVPKGKERFERIIADAILKTNKNVKVVLKRADVHQGEFRTQKMEWLAGEKRKETIHKENGVKIMLNVEKVYYSPRLSTERMRIAKQVKPGEDVLVMFSGCAPFCCVIAKNSKAKSVFGIEKNKVGHDYGIKNIIINKLKNIYLINGDVKEVAPRIEKRFDRIVMPLPKSAGDFLEYAFMLSKKIAIIHFYDFQREGEFQKSEEKILAKCRELGRKCEIIRTVSCGAYSPRVFRICVDFIARS